jgi:YD repeat-containing protein
MLRRAAAALVMAACLGSTWLVHANSDESTPEEQFHRRIKMSDDIKPLGEDAFGETVDLYTGELFFRQVDLTLKGTGPDIVIARTFSPGWRTSLDFPEDGAFADWQLDVPRLTSLVGAATSGAYANFGGEWQANGQVPDNRCANMANAPLLPGTNGSLFDSIDWWHGYALQIPGEESQSVLSRGPNTPQPTITDANGQPVVFPAMTASHWMIGCEAGTASGEPGDAFLAVSPTGLRYHLNWLNYYSSPSATLANPPPGKHITARIAAAEAVATKVEDRFGNWIQYHYNGRRLASIDASDGRLVTFTWRPETDWVDHIAVTGASGASRTWTYQYADESQLVANTTQYLGRLSAVALPDGSSWQFGLQGLLSATVGQSTGISPSCAHGYFQVSNQGKSFDGTIQAPSGLSGTFTVSPTQRVREGDGRPPATCSTTEVPYFQPASYFNIALTQKHYTGAGVDSLWSYAYGNPTLYWADECPNGVCPAHTAWTDVTQPDATIVRTEFDNTMNGPLEGKIVATRSGLNAQDGSATRVEVDGYADVAAAGLGNPLGFVLDPLANTNRLNNQQPLDLRQISQDGNIFTWTADGFDAFAQPAAITRASDVAGQLTAHEQHTYLNDSTHWLLSLPLSTVNADSQEIMQRNNYDASTSLLSAHYAFEHLLMSYQYDAQGRLASFTDGNNHTTTLGNYKLDVPQSVTFADQTAEQFVVDDFGDITSATDPTGATTQYHYDALGRMAEVDYPSSATESWSAKRYSYGFAAGAERGIGAGHWVRAVTEGPKTTTTYFDALWRPMLVTTSDSGTGAAITTSTGYDWAGRQSFASYPANGSPDYVSGGAGVTTTYDVLGRTTLQTATSELGNLNTATAYLPGATVQVTDPRGKVTSKAYQVFDEPDTSRPLSVATGGIVQTIARDIYGNVHSLSQGTAAGMLLTRTWLYDGYYRLCRIRDPESGDRVMAYDAADNVAWAAAGLALSAPATSSDCGYDQVPAAAQTTRAYDALNRMTSIVYPAGTDPATFTYDHAGRQLTATSGLVSWTFGYNLRGLLTAEHLSVDGFNFPLDYGYTTEGVVASVTYPDGKTVEATPDGLGRPTGAGSYASGAQYFPDGKLQAFNLGNQATYLATENDRQLLSSQTYGTAAAMAVSQDLTFDEDGNIVSRSDLTPSHQRTASFAYDDLNRLASASAAGLWGTETYGYDALNNLARLTNTDGESDYSYDASNKLTAITRGGAAIHTFAYDGRGNTVKRDGATLTFDQADRLLGIQGQDGYLYDAAGRRVRSQDGQGNPKQYWAYNGAGKLMFAYDPATTEGTDYIYLGPQLVASTQNSLSKVTGNVDGVSNATAATADLLGWACSTGLAQSIQVEAFVNGGPGVGTSMGTFTANLASDATVAQACQVSGGAYRFDIPLSDAFRIAHPGQSLYVVGKSPNGGADVTLPGSGGTGAVVPPSVSAPAAPASVAAAAAADLSSIRVNWTAATNASSYNVQEQVNGGAWQAVPGVSGTAVTIGQPADATYGFQVQACNANGCSTYTAGNAVTIRHIPAAPAAISVPASSTGAIAVSWSATAYATSYELQENVNGGGWASVYSGAGTSTVIGIGASSSVSFQVRACNANGCGPFSVSGAVAVTVPPASAPSLSGGGASSNGAYGLSWTAVGGATSYTLFESINGGAAAVVQSANATSWATSGRGNGTYAYQVQACNAAGCGPISGAVAVVVSLIPAAPSPLINDSSNGKIDRWTVSWAAVAGATRYEAIRSDTQAQVYSGTALSFLLGTTQEPAVLKYTALVRACNDTGCSAYAQAD